MDKIFGIDVSKWQGNFDFKKAMSEGVKFAILRGAYSCGKDSKFDSYYNTCKSLGLPVGVYHYSMAETVKEAVEEANFLINNVLKGKQFEYPVYMDVEDKVQRVLGKDLLTDIVIAFCDTLEKDGYYVGIYSSSSFFKTYMHESKLERFDKWIAQWSKSCTYKGNYGMWQFGGETNLIRKNIVADVVCDQDYAYYDYPSIMKEKGLNGFGLSNVKDKTVEELANEVINGLWGNGEDRKNRLTNAGYNYKEVQNMVNTILGGTPIIKPQLKSIDEIAKEVIRGKWGNGAERKNRLAQAGYDYNSVQARVNQLLK